MRCDLHYGTITHANQNEYIIVICNYFTKWKEEYAIHDHTTQTVDEVLINECICRVDTPRCIHTDQGHKFESHLFSELCCKLALTKTHTTPYRP